MTALQHARPINATGTALGRKGMETRERLLEAARRLLKHCSPFNLTVIAIAREAETAPPTFYVYFSDLGSLLHDLAVEAGRDLVGWIATHPALFAGPQSLADDSRVFVDGFNRVWDEHSDILLYRNLEADRGNMAFLELRTASAIPFIDRLAEAVQLADAAVGMLSRTECYAEAIVLYAAVERLAASRYQYRERTIGPGIEELRNAQARIITRCLASRERD